MEKAKQAVSNFISRDGKHKTSVDEDVRTGVTEEHVKPHRHEEVTTAVDREVHQDHHQTVIQPIKAQETLPEQHKHNMVPVEHKTVHHGNDQELKKTLDADQARFRDTSTVHDTTQSTSAAGVIEGEHVHHHVHQHVQPVIQKEVLQPEVVHTTIPVHETHHAAPIHHETTTLPVKTLDEYTLSKGETTGAGLNASAPKKLNEFDGCPNPKDKTLREDGRAQQVLHGQGP